MATIHSVVNQPNDQFGYSCYSLVIPASAELIAQVEALRNEMGVTVASIPAHVTVKGTFFEIASLDQVKQHVEEVTSRTAPFFINFAEQTFHWGTGGGALVVPVTPPLQALHDVLVASISPLALPAYQDDPYLVHMTLVYGQSPERLQQAQEVIRQMDFGAGFMAEAVHLMGRVGPRVGGEWKLIQRFALDES
jgi:2'-5' RNA ligase